MRRSPPFLIILAAATAACAEPLGFADWRIDVPEGTPVIELAGVPLAERSPDAVQLADDLVLGASDDNPEVLFYRPLGIVADDQGRMYVANQGDNRVLMFAPDGAYLGNFGREGQGPGEFGAISRMAIVGEHIVIEDYQLRRISVWTVDGKHVADYSPERLDFFLSVEGMGAEGFVASIIRTTPEGDRRLRLAQYSVEGTEIVRLLDVPSPPPLRIRDGESPTAELVRDSIKVRDYPRVLSAVAGPESVYVSPAHEYQVLATTREGEAAWALRVAWPRPNLARSTKTALIERMSRFGTGTASIGDFDWPPAPALEFLRSDGAGNLYVFPTMPREEDEPPSPRMVDVYSPEGEFLAAGLVDYVWTYARGDYVYGLRVNADGDQVAVRYRLTVERR